MNTPPFIRAIREMRDRQVTLSAAATEPAPLTSWLEKSRRVAEEEPKSPGRIFAALLFALTLLGVAGGLYEWLVK